MIDLLDVALLAFASVVGLVHLRTRLFKCPDCGFRSDADHIVEATREAPYCSYCGGHMDYVGRKIDAWKAHFVGSELRPKCKADKVEPEGVARGLVKTFVEVVKR